MFYLLALRAAVAAAAPNVAIRFETVTRPVNLDESLRDGVVDIAIDWLPIEQDPFVNGKLFDEHLILLARHGHPSVDVGVTLEDLRKAEFVTIHHRRDASQAPLAIRELLKLGLNEAVHVSELLEIPALVATTDLVGIFAASMGPCLEQRVGLQVLPMPFELPPLPIYMIWHGSRRQDVAHRWLREVVAKELSRFAPG